MKKQKNKGISLIVLVITIIVMIILATAVVLTLSNSGIINKANDAVDATNLRQVQDLAAMLWADKYLDSEGKATKEELEEAVLTGLGNVEGLNLDNYIVEVTEKGVTVEIAVALTPSEKYYGVKNVVPTNPKYFEYDYDETTMTATIIGVKDTYAIKEYYRWSPGSNSLLYNAGILGKSGNAITDVVVPYETTDEEGNIYTITSIGESALGVHRDFEPYDGGNGYTSYTSIVLPNTITDIDEYAFHGGKNIANIIIPTSVENIGKGAFKVCSGISNVYYRGSETEWQDIVIGYNDELTKANIIYNYTGMLDGVGLGEQEVEEPEYLETSKNSQYFEYEYDTTNMTATITGVKNSFSGTTYYAAYDGKTYQTKAIVDSSGNIIRELIIPSTTVDSNLDTYVITAIGDDAFSYNSSITSVVIPNTVTSIGNHAFMDCQAIISVTIPDSVTSLGSLAFIGCYDLTNLVLGTGITSIPSLVFHNLPKLTNVYYTGSQDKWNNITIGSNNTGLTNATITYNYTTSTNK